MASYGYQSDHVNLIADNLRDRYKSGFPILKELIQNADDAKARRLVFGMHPGFKGQSSHPLLQGPGLWVFNDGQFKKEDERAIRSFGLNSKAGESGAIGKFGLGMKSVFHLCEAFFYVAHDGQQNFDVLLNPWRDPDSDDLFHGAWDQVGSQEFDALRAVVAKEQLDKGCQSWFLMWIPLRRRDHVPQKDGRPFGGIVDKYPGDGGSNEMQFLSDQKLSRKIRSVVPLLRSLESIELASTGAISGFKVQISFDEGTLRVDHRSAELVSTGSVSDGGASKGKLRFRVQQQARPGALPFSQFKKLDVWPKTGRLNSDGIREPVPDKSEAEGAVMVSGAAADGEEAKLVIDWAVFLPMEEGLSYEFRLEKSQQQYRIVLHGQFFVDAGRRGIAGFAHLADPSLVPSPDLDDADLHTGWNQTVAQQVILPQLLPALAEFANDLSENEKEELARAILSARSKSSATGIGKGFWENFRDFVCQGQAWVRLINPDGLKWSLVKITNDTRLLKLPRPPKHDLERTWKVLPRLKKLVEEGCLLIDEEAPSLMRTHSDWDVATLLDVLDCVDFEEACSETGMSYLIRFLSLEQRRYVNAGDVQRKLTALLRSMLQRESIQTFRSIRSTFQDLVSLVKPDYRFAIGTKRADAVTGLSDITLKLLISSEVAKVILPMDLDPEKDNVSKGLPDENEVGSLLKAIDQEISQHTNLDGGASSEQFENLLRAAQWVLELLSDKKDERGIAIRVNRSLRVLTATCARSGRSHAVSFSDLQMADQKGLLFKQQGFGPVAYSVASALAGLLPSEQVWVVGAEIAGWIYQRGDPNSMQVPSGIDHTAAYATLGRRGRKFVLADMNVRSRFIRTISPSSVKGDDVIRGMRYVLHGSDIHHDDVDATLWINADRTDEVWIKLKCMVDPNSWSVVDSKLAGAIKADDWEKLGICKVGADEVIEHMMGGSSIDKVEASQFTDVEISDILIRIADEELWKALPIHRDTSGGFGPIDDHCYVDSVGLAKPQFLKGVRGSVRISVFEAG